MESFEAFVRQHGRRLESYAYLLCGDAGRSQDLVQQALIGVYRHWSRVAAMEHPEAYARRAVTSRYLDWRRRLSTRESPVLDLVPADSSPDPADLTASADLVRRALLALSRQQRSVLVMRHYLGCSDAEIAAELGCRETTVRAHASRGLARLRTDLTLTDQEERWT